MNAIKLLTLEFCLLNGFVFVCYSQQTYHTIDINTDVTAASLKHFWESTGLCPPLPHYNASEFLLSVDMMQNLLLMSSVPHQGLKQVRIHWLLELIKKSNSVYNFNSLDQLLQFMYKIGLKPGFEIMGNPSGYFTNFDDMHQITEFKELVTTLAQRYISMFGLKYVSSWNFETWNEPNNGDFDNLTVTTTGFLKYYDACSEGLKQANLLLVFGGPGGSCKHSSFSKLCGALFEHVVNGTNFITGKKGSRLDFISVHKKGSGKSDVILQSELEAITAIHNQYPTLASTPIFNDEADPLVGWNKPQFWRADVTYAALITKVISQHQNQIIANISRSHINYALLSNDNGFLNFSPHYFSQRTLNGRFQVNNTKPQYVHFVKKPSLIVLGLLSKLGDKQMSTFFVNEQIGGIASICTACPHLEISTLLYNSVDSEPFTGVSFIHLRYYNLFNSSTFKLSRKSWNDSRSVVCSLNNLETNPNGVWEEMGKPDFPSSSQFQLMHEQEEPHCSEPSTIRVDSEGRVVVDMTLHLPGVVLHHMCVNPGSAPGRPLRLSAFNITIGQVLLTWSDAQIETKCIKTFQIEFAAKSQPQTFEMVNKVKVLFNSFTVIRSSVIGYYRVVAIDYWNRKGTYSDVLSYF